MTRAFRPRSAFKESSCPAREGTRASAVLQPRVCLLLLLAFSLLLSVPPACLGQRLLQIEKEFACASQAGPIPSEAYIFPPSDRVTALVQQIVDSLGLTAGNIKLHAANVPNALAYIDPISQDRLILYNEDFVVSMQGDTGSVWVWRATLAHELSHHLDSHLQNADPTRRKEEELEADRFAGSSLARFGASEEEVIKVFEGFASGESYPPTSARVAAARNGWQLAPKPPVPDPEEEVVRDDPVECPEGLGGKAMCPTVGCTTNTITMYGTITCAKKKAARYCAQTHRAATFEKEMGKMDKWPIMLFRCAPAG